MRFCGTLRAGILFFLKHRNDTTVVGDCSAVGILRRVAGITAPPLGGGKGLLTATVCSRYDVADVNFSEVLACKG